MFLKPKIELIYVIYPVVHYCFHLEGPCLPRCYSHISSKHVDFSLHKSSAHNAARPASHAQDQSLCRGLRTGIAHWGLCPSLGDHWASLTPLLGLWGVSHRWKSKAIATHRSCLSQSMLTVPLPFQNSISKSLDVTHPTLLLPGSWNQSSLAHWNYGHRHYFTNTLLKTLPDHQPC